MTLSATAIEEKNKLGTDSIFLPCLKITIPGVSIPIRVVRDNQDLTWQGETWIAFPFEIDEINKTSKGEIPQINIRVSNRSRVIEAYLQQYDTYCKTYGYSVITVDIYIVNTRAIALDSNCDAEVEHSFILKQPKTNAEWATFVLSADNVYGLRVPQGRILKNSCRFKFKDTRCGYAGAVNTCNKTITACRALSNSTRFGAFPGVGTGGYTIASS